MQREHDDDATAQIGAANDPATARMRVAIVLDSHIQPAWVCALIDNLQQSAAAEITGVTLMPAQASRRVAGEEISALYLRLDGIRFRRRDGDAVDPCDIRTFVRASIPPAGADVDLVIDLTTESHQGGSAEHPRKRGTEQPVSPRLGTWFVRFADDSRGLRQFFDSLPSTVATIVCDLNGQLQTVGSVRCGTDLISYRRGMNRLWWSVGTLIFEKISAAARGIDVFAGCTPLTVLEPPGGGSRTASPVGEAGQPVRLARGRADVGTSGGPDVERISADDVPLTPVAAIARAYAREVRQKVRDRWMRQQWIVAYGPRLDPEHPDGIAGFHRIVPPEDRIWADPFLVERDGRLFIFVEEMEYRQRRGRIAVIEADLSGKWSTPKTILERPHHLSYPCVFQWNGDDYMLPESGEGRTIELFRCVSFPDRWELAAVLFRDIHAVDSTMFEAFGRWWMYTSVSANRRTFEELLLFHAESPFGPWEPHRLNPLTIDTIGGRCAGLPFEHEGRLYRAAQIGTRRYGYALQIREIEKLTPDEWVEHEASRILPVWQRDLAGTHTLNVSGAFSVIDGVRYRWK